MLVSICANASRNSIVTIADGGIRAEMKNLSVCDGYGDELWLDVSNAYCVTGRKYFGKSPISTVADGYLLSSAKAIPFLYCEQMTGLILMQNRYDVSIRLLG